MSDSAIISLLNSISARCNGGGYPESIQNPVIHMLQCVLTMPLVGEEFYHNQVVGGDGDTPVEPELANPEGHELVDENKPTS